MRIGYALGGGGARGLAHIGVLKVLDQEGLHADVVAGTSIGAIIGALYAGGYTGREIEKIALGLDWKKLLMLVDMTLPLSGLLQGRRVVSLLRSILGDLTFPELKCSFKCVATDIVTGEEVVIGEGSLLEAIRASISIPGIFTPASRNGRFLVDGGLINTVPVSVCREMGAEYVIGVNVIPEPGRLLCNPAKNQDNEVCDFVPAGADEPEPPSTPSGRRSLQTHISDIEYAAGDLLTDGRKSRKGRMPGSVDSKARPVLHKAPRLVDVLSQTLTILEYRIAAENVRQADLIINPQLQEIGFWQFHNAAQAIAAGERATRAALQQAKVPWR